MKAIALLLLSVTLAFGQNGSIPDWFTNINSQIRKPMSLVGTADSYPPGKFFMVGASGRMNDEWASLTNLVDWNSFLAGYQYALGALQSQIQPPSQTNIAGTIISNTASPVYLSNGVSGVSIIPANTLYGGQHFSYFGRGIAQAGSITFAKDFAMMVYWGNTTIASNSVANNILSSITADISYELQITVCLVTNNVAVLKVEGDISIIDTTLATLKIVPFVAGSRIVTVPSNVPLQVYGGAKYSALPPIGDYVRLDQGWAK